MGVLTALVTFAPSRGVGKKGDGWLGVVIHAKVRQLFAFAVFALPTAPHTTDL